MSAGAFRVLLRYLHTQELPGAEDGGEGLVAGEMAKAADYFQAGELYEHCVEQFKGGLRVGNVVERLVQAHDMKLEALEEAALGFLQQHALAFQVAPCSSFRCSRNSCFLRAVTQSCLLERAAEYAGGPASSVIFEPSECTNNAEGGHTNVGTTC